MVEAKHCTYKAGAMYAQHHQHSYDVNQRARTDCCWLCTWQGISPIHPTGLSSSTQKPTSKPEMTNETGKHHSQCPKLPASSTPAVPCAPCTCSSSLLGRCQVQAGRQQPWLLTASLTQPAMAKHRKNWPGTDIMIWRPQSQVLLQGTKRRKNATGEPQRVHALKTEIQWYTGLLATKVGPTDSSHARDATIHT